MNRLALASLPLLLPGFLGAVETNGFSAAVGPDVSHALTWEFASGYLSSSGVCCDTCPITSQELDGEIGFGAFGWIDYYAWIVSSLHDRQSDEHRWYFNEFECAVHYGYLLELPRDWALKSQFGFYWNPQIGYYDLGWEYWGLHLVQSIENPYLVPYWNALWLMEPMRTRVRLGLRHAFALTDTLTLTPSVEFVWIDGRRCRAKYGADPQDAFLDGTFTTCIPSVRLDWAFAENWTVYLLFRYLTTINGQVRAAVDACDAYYAVNDWPFVSLGVTYSF